MKKISFFTILILISSLSFSCEKSQNPLNSIITKNEWVGNKIVMTVFVPDFYSSIYIIDLDGNNQKKMLPEIFAGDPRFVPNSSKILYSIATGGNEGIYVTDTLGQSSDLVIAGDHLYNLRVALDASHVLFQRNINDNKEIFLTNFNGDFIQNISNHDSSDMYPEFSPDSKSIVFNSNRNGNWEIYKYELNGTIQNLSNNPAMDIYPTFSPDGREILFSSKRDGNWEVYKMSVSGSNQINLSKNSALDLSPEFSPDGNLIVFESNRSGNSGIYIMNSDGSSQEVFSNDPRGDFIPRFSPDGSKIAFRNNGQNGLELHIKNLDGTNLINLSQSIPFNVLDFDFERNLKN